MALYGNILEALDSYYGADVMQKVYNRGVQLGLSGNKQWGDYYKLLANNTDDLIEWTTKSGKSVGLWSVRGTTSTTEVALSSTATDLVSVDMALGTEVGEYAGKQIPKLVTAGGTSGSTTVGSFVVGEVLPAIGAAACGVALGVAVDKLLYESNPDYWDEKLPTLNPETWDDIILGHDTKIPFLHNTNNGKTYINENMLAYTGLFANGNGWFDTYDEYDVKTDDIFKGYSSPVYSLSAVMSQDAITNDGRRFTYDIKYDCKCVIPPQTPASVGGGTYMVTVLCFSDNENEVLLANKNKYYEYKGDVITYQNQIGSSYTTSYELNGKTVYYGTASYRTNSSTLPFSPFSMPANGKQDKAVWVAQYGSNTEHHSNAPKGVNKIGVTPDLSGLTTIDEVIPKLRTTYPDMYNNAIDIPYYDVDTDTTTTNKWIPATIPTDFVNTDDNIINKPNNKPVSTNLKQTNDGSYPDNDTENKAKENTITEGSTPSTPDNIDPINPILPSEDTPNIIIPNTDIDTGLGAVYVPTIEQLNSFSQWLWSPNFIDQIKKLFSDPMQGIIGLHQIYFTPEHNGTDTIHCGYLDSGVSSDYTKKRYIKINCGSVNVKETFGNIFDYDPLTTIECYLPFIGIVPLKVGDVMRSTISIEYICDVLTGACLCNIYVLRDDIKALLYTYGGNCAVNYPLSSGSYMGIVSSLVGVTMSVATGIISGGTSIPLSIGGGAMSLLNAKTNVKTSGGYSGNTGAMGVKKPYLIIKNTLTSMPDNYNKYIGNAYNDIKNISECVGYSVIENVQLIGEMTDTEKEEIKNYLESGVII